MRLDHVKKFPYAMTLGAINNLETSYITGREIGQQLKKLGVHINFGPVVDVNSNPNNPIIGFRSFGDDPTKIGEQATAYNKGMESTGVWGCAKHFPGHGNTIADSHLELPHVTHDKKSIKKDTYLGDIIISFNYMNKDKEKRLFKTTVIKTFIHGFLHLLGFDHIKDKDYKKMITEENKIYKSVISKLN